MSSACPGLSALSDTTWPFAVRVTGEMDLPSVASVIVAGSSSAMTGGTGEGEEDGGVGAGDFNLLGGSR